MIDSLLRFWFAAETKQNWFNAKDQDAFDEILQQRFGDLLEKARKGELDAWSATPRGALALTVILDQLPRNLFRGTPGAYAMDSHARKIASRAIDAAFDCDMMLDARCFLYLPFQHSEDLEDQERSVQLNSDLGCPHYLDYAERHHVIIARFGRFPHRNKILGRESTPEEIDFLKQPNSSF